MYIILHRSKLETDLVQQLFHYPEDVCHIVVMLSFSYRTLQKFTKRQQISFKSR